MAKKSTNFGPNREQKRLYGPIFIVFKRKRVIGSDYRTIDETTISEYHGRDG